MFLTQATLSVTHHCFYGRCKRGASMIRMGYGIAILIKKYENNVRKNSVDLIFNLALHAVQSLHARRMI